MTPVVINLLIGLTRLVQKSALPVQGRHLDAVLFGEVSHQIVDRSVQQPVWVEALDLRAHVAVLGVNDRVDIRFVKEKFVLAAHEVQIQPPVVQPGS